MFLLGYAKSHHCQTEFSLREGTQIAKGNIQLYFGLPLTLPINHSITSADLVFKTGNRTKTQDR